jgi:ribose transport system ATP-binding protein
VADNVALPVLERLRRRLGLFDGDIVAHAARLGAEAGVKPNAPALPLSALSGGNAQKALVAKWLQTGRGCCCWTSRRRASTWARARTSGTRSTAPREAGRRSSSASTDYEQLAQLCHRVLVFAAGQVVDELRARP